MPLIYYCLMCGQKLPASAVLKENMHMGRNGRLCGPVDMWEQDRKDDFEEFDESEEDA